MTAVTIEGVGRVNFPDDYTPERIKFAIENDILPRMDTKKPNTRPQEEVMFRQQIRRESAPTTRERLGRGVADVTQGVKQAGLMVKDLVTGSEDADPYTADKTEEVKRYENLRNDGGIDAARLSGNVGMTAPAALIPGGLAASLPARMASGATSGAVASGAMFTPEGESKGSQIATGLIMGAVAPAAGAAVKSGVRTVKGLISPEVNMAIPAQAQKLVGELEIKLQQQGVDWNKLSGTVKDSLLKDAQGTLNAGGTLDDLLLSRKAAIESIPGVKATRAAVTRAPRDWQEEKNLRGITGVGDEIVQREQSNAQAMIDYLSKLRGATGGKASTALEAGESAVKAIRTGDAAKKNAVDDLYTAYRESGQKGVSVPETKLMQSLTGILDDVGQENIPPAVQSRLKEFGFLGGNRTRYLTVDEADKFNRLLNANNPGHGPQSLTIGRLRSALNESLVDIPGGGETLTRAREAAAQRFSEIKSGKGIAAAIDDVTPDRFVKKFVMDSDERDLRAMMLELGKSAQGKQAIQDVKGHVMDNLLLKATGATNVDDLAGRRFSGVAFSKAIDAIPPEKLHLMFSPAEIESLRSLQKASKLLTEEVPFSDVNHSKTSAALANLFLKIGNTPMLGKIVSPILGTAKVGMDWVKDANARKQVAEALLGSAGKAGTKTTILPQKLEKLVPAGAATVLNRASEDLDQEQK